MANPIYIMFDVDCNVKVLTEGPTTEEVIGWYDGRYIKVEDSKVYISWVINDSEWEWVEVTNDSN